MNPPSRRPGIRPPQPVDPGNSQWLAMFYQWVIDTLTHLDECMDKTQVAHEETRTELATWMLAAKESDQTFAEKLREHIEEHSAIDRGIKDRKSVWSSQWEWIKDGTKFATSGTAMALIIVVMKWIGVI